MINGKNAVFYSGSPPQSKINVNEEFIPIIVFDKKGIPRFRFEDCVYYKDTKRRTITFRCIKEHVSGKLCSNCASGTYNCVFRAQCKTTTSTWTSRTDKYYCTGPENCGKVAILTKKEEEYYATIFPFSRLHNMSKMIETSEKNVELKQSSCAAVTPKVGPFKIKNNKQPSVKSFFQPVEKEGQNGPTPNKKKK